MAKYTVELRQIVENHIPIFDFNYPFYNEEKRKEFEERFIKHFYFHEIGCETVERFKWYLEDKMNVVFPYYNELFKSASIEYEVLDNYKLTETYERNVENKGKSSGISSTVGQTIDKQESESNQNKTVDNIGNVDTIGKDTTKESANSESNTTSSNTTNTTNEGTTNNTSQNIKKYMDTPQGLTDLTNSNYLTNLTQDNGSGEQTTNGNSNQTVNGSENTVSENGKNINTDTLSNTESTNKETTADKIENVSSQETKTTADNNTRTYNEGEQIEKYTLTRKGNIGVDTDSDAIEKHNRLQKTLKNIERMFFEECNDLFMLVY